MRKILLVLLLTAACSSTGTVTAELPEDANSALRCYAAKEDFAILQRDVNAFIALPTTSRATAERIDVVLDAAEDEIVAHENRVKAGLAAPGSCAYDILLNSSSRIICATAKGEIPACVGR